MTLSQTVLQLILPFTQINFITKNFRPIFLSKIKLNRGFIMNKRLTRSVKDKVIGGVAGGLAEYFEIDPVLVRVLFVVSLFFHGAGFIAYIILWIIVPQAPYVFDMSNNVNSSLPGETSPNVQTDSENQAASYLKQLDEKKSRRHRSAGIVLIIIGCIFLADNFIPRFHFSDFWPLILIAIGASLLINSKGN